MANLQDALQDLDAYLTEVSALTEFPTWELTAFTALTESPTFSTNWELHQFVHQPPQEEAVSTGWQPPVLTAPPSPVSDRTSEESPRSEDTSSDVDSVVLDPGDVAMWGMEDEDGGEDMEWE